MKTLTKVRIIIGITGLLLIIAGVLQNDYREVLMKAIRVCLECIGIG